MSWIMMCGVSYLPGFADQKHHLPSPAAGSLSLLVSRAFCLPRWLPELAAPALAFLDSSPL